MQQPPATTTNPSSSHQVSLGTALEILREAGTEMAALDGRQPKGFGRELNREEGLIGRQLAVIADQLALAQALVRNEYWAVKGETSYEF